MQKWLESKPSRDKMRSAFRGVCQAITFLHSNGIIHAGSSKYLFVFLWSGFCSHMFDLSRPPHRSEA
jgi:hypothetical protein